jgi:hypothetical protein
MTDYVVRKMIRLLILVWVVVISFQILCNKTGGLYELAKARIVDAAARHR